MDFKNIYGRGGHNFKAVGAVDIIDEVVENRKIMEYIDDYMSDINAGYTNCNPPSNIGSNGDLSHGVNKCNVNKGDFFFSVHFNSCSGGRRNSDIGVECCIYAPGGKAFPVAEKICNSISSITGLKNRGVKNTPSLYELKNTNCPAVIIEVCFVNSYADVNKYKGKEKEIARVIVESITGVKIVNKPVENKPVNKGVYRVVAGSYSEKENALKHKEKLEKAGFSAFLVYEKNV